MTSAYTAVLIMCVVTGDHEMQCPDVMGIGKPVILDIPVASAGWYPPDIQQKLMLHWDASMGAMTFTDGSCSYRVEVVDDMYARSRCE